MPLLNKVRMTVDEWRDKLSRRGFTEDNKQIVDSTPIAPPIGYRRQPTMVEHIRNMVRSEQLRLAAEAAGSETFEEADDFDTGEEDFPVSGYENDFEPPAVVEAAAVQEADRIEAERVASELRYQERLEAARKKAAAARAPSMAREAEPDPERAAAPRSST